MFSSFFVHDDKIRSRINNILNGAEYIFKIKINKLKEKWLGPESNQRHMDFQSTALPTELPSHTQNRFDYIENRSKITWSIQQNKNI